MKPLVYVNNTSVFFLLMLILVIWSEWPHVDTGDIVGSGLSVIVRIFNKLTCFGSVGILYILTFL